MDSSKVYLVQTDTTVGFSSSYDEKLSRAKQRPSNQKILQTVESFSTLQQKTRIPKKYKKRIRNSSKTTFIYPNLNSFRVVSPKSSFYAFIKKFKILYSTSANKTSHSFNYDFAIKKSDTTVESKEGFFETTASSIYKVTKSKIKKIR